MSAVDTKEIINRLDSAAVLNLLAPDGLLAKSIKGFELRQQQANMMENVLDAYNHNQISLIEAGTGTGKSLAYLIPALLWAAQTKERTVISTNTIPLQEQLLLKDIPTLIKALKLDLRAVIVKGMSNYVCLRKFQETQEESLLLNPKEAEEFAKLEGWRANTKDGSRSSLPFAPSATLWEKVAAESDTCTRTKCPYYEECLFFKARRRAADAQILVVNHHILFADLVRRQESEDIKDPGILPSYSRLIIDEAHNIEDIATDYFASHISQMEILRLLARLTSENGEKVQGKLPLLKSKLTSHYKNEHTKEVTSLFQRLTFDLPGFRQELIKATHDTFQTFFEFVHHFEERPLVEESTQGDNKLRLLDVHQAGDFWKLRIIPQCKTLLEAFARYVGSLDALQADVKHLKNQTLEEQLGGILFEIDALRLRLEGLSDILSNFIKENLPPNQVRWIEIQALKSAINTALIDANLDLSQLLVDYLFSKFATIILCSATLTTNNGFHFVRNRLGLIEHKLKNREIKENIYDSPFNFERQALFGIPTDIPNPMDPKFTQEAAKQIAKILKVSRGNAFVLFTSYSMLKTCYDILANELKEQRFNVLKQGDADRRSLLTRFKTEDRSVLFGTDSFWEGVDVVGEALRCVIIVKLPFKVPTDPLIQARSELIAKNGGEPFMDYSLPQAIVKFKQGFGRLIRNRTDRGCIVCLDNRILTKRYGKLFLKTLPDCQKAFLPSEELYVEMEKFYKRPLY